jgi:predicted permease
MESRARAMAAPPTVQAPLPTSPARPGLDTLIRDLTLGLRLLRRNPLFTLSASLSLAIGIGAATAVFTVANAMLLRTASGVTGADRLVDVSAVRRNQAVSIVAASYPTYVDLRSRLTSLEGLYAYQAEVDAASLRVGEGGGERVFTNLVSLNYFGVLGVRAAAGRFFTDADDERPGAAPVAVLSHRLWSQRFGSDPGIVGRVLRINGQPLTVVGVAAPDFRGMSVLAADVWVPISMVAGVKPDAGARPLTVRDVGWLLLGGRLRSGVSRAQASAEVAVVGAAVQRENPTTPRGGLAGRGGDAESVVWSAEASSPIPYGLRTVIGGFLILLMMIVTLVLSIACANLAGVLLARGATRRREIAMRVAAGAPRARLIRQLLTETMLLFTCGGIAGLLLARAMTSGLVALMPAFPLPVNVSMPLDMRVVVFALALSLIAALLSGLAPAFRASRVDVLSSLKEFSQDMPDRLRLRNLFVIGQVALSVVLVVAAVLVGRTLRSISSVEHGFDPTGVETTSIDLSMAGFSDRSGPQFARELLERVRTVPGVQSATIADRAPGPNAMSLGEITVPDASNPTDEPLFPNWTLVEQEYFSTLRIPILAGRDFAPTDRAGSQPVAIVGESTARRFWPGRSALGRVLVAAQGGPQAGAAGAAPTRMVVVGVVKDVTFGEPGSSGNLAIYVPLQQRYLPTLTILARVSGDRYVSGDLRALIASSSSNLPVLSEERLDRAAMGPAEIQLRIASAVAGTLGLVGVLLAAVGVYGVTAYAVARRTREIGIRLSLGAQGGHVVGLVLRQGLMLVVIGLLIGSLLAVGAGRLLAASPLATPPPDMLTLAGAVLLFLVVGVLACCWPIRRASRINPVEALRYE